MPDLTLPPSIEHFTVHELVASDIAQRRRIKNDLPANLHANAIRTLTMAERVRSLLNELAPPGAPEIGMYISSGYRSPALNAAVGSKPDSAHVLAAAIDFRADAFGTPTEICCALEPRCDELDIGQLINEYPADAGRSGWVHISWRAPARPVNAVITITAAGPRAGIWSA